MRLGILGAGAMGARIARNLKQRGHEIAIYNRSPARTVELAAEGLHIVPTPRAAATDAECVIALLRDDEASRSVWLDTDIGALSGLRPREPRHRLEYAFAGVDPGTGRRYPGELSLYLADGQRSPCRHASEQFRGSTLCRSRNDRSARQ